MTVLDKCVEKLLKLSNWEILQVYFHHKYISKGSKNCEGLGVATRRGYFNIKQKNGIWTQARVEITFATKFCDAPRKIFCSGKEGRSLESRSARSQSFSGQTPYQRF